MGDMSVVFCCVHNPTSFYQIRHPPVAETPSTTGSANCLFGHCNDLDCFEAYQLAINELKGKIANLV